MRKIAESAGRLQSCADAAFALGIADIKISSRHVQRLAAEIGRELEASRDSKAARKRRELPVRVPATPEAVVVEVDGGRLRTRAPGCGPGVHQHQHKEDKIACLATLDSRTRQEDPQPEPPESFREPRRVRRLVQQMKGFAGDKPAEEMPQEGEASPAPAPAEPRPPSPSPSPRVRTCVATMADCRAFGRMVAAEAQERDFYRAKRRAFVADGAAYNWTLQRTRFADFEPIADFLHALCYVWLAAWGAGGDEEGRWALYLGWLRACWQGRAGEVVEDLRKHQERLGEPPEGEADAKDPRRLVADAARYLGNNKERMDYPRYRKAGLPVTSSLAESLVGQFNTRMKGREKFWNRPEGAEAILQLRAAVLSEDDRLARHFAQRPGNPRRRRAA